MMQPVVQFANKLEIRYYFNDRSGYMDAFILNKCEKNIIFLLRTVADMLNIKMMIYTEPCEGEGYRERFPIAGRNSRAVSILLRIVIQLLAQPLVSADGRPYSTITPKRKEMLREKITALTEELSYQYLKPYVPDDIVDLLNSVPELQRYKAHFYETLKSYPKVVRIAFRELNENNNIRKGALVVKREQFSLYVSKDTKKKEEDDRQLKLDIFD